MEQKGYEPADILVDHPFDVHLDGQCHQGVAELVVFVENKPFMTIKNKRGSLVSRENEARAASRLAFDVQVPITVVTNGQEAEVLDTLTGKVIAEGLAAIPTKSRAVEMSRELRYLPLPDHFREKLCRIYMAYAVFQCANFCT